MQLVTISLHLYVQMSLAKTNCTNSILNSNRYIKCGSVLRLPDHKSDKFTIYKGGDYNNLHKTVVENDNYNSSYC